MSSPLILLVRTVQSSDLRHRRGAGSENRRRLQTAGRDHAPAVSNRRPPEESQVCEWACSPINCFISLLLFFYLIGGRVFSPPVCGGERGAVPTLGRSQRRPKTTDSGGNIQFPLRRYCDLVVVGDINLPHFVARHSFRSWRRNTPSASRCCTKLRRN